jgi:SAM-dependent methyltransferase
MKRFLKALLRPFAAPLAHRLDGLAVRLEDSDRRIERDLGERLDRLERMMPDLAEISRRIDHLARHAEVTRYDVQTELSAVKVMVSKFPWFAELYPPDQRWEETTADDLADLQMLMDNVAEIYQDVVVAGRVIRRGVRECESRLAALLPQVDDGDTVLDVGSSFGYFGRGIAAARPRSVVVSVEKDRASVALQRRLLLAERAENVILVHGEVDLEWMRRANAACTFFDDVLLLSVLHHFSAADLPGVLAELDRLGARLLVELPETAEEKVCGREPVTVLASHGGDLNPLLPSPRARIELGKTASHLHPEITRSLAAYARLDLERVAGAAYVGDPGLKLGPDGAPRFVFRRRPEGGWSFAKGGQESAYVPGVSLWDVRQLGRVVWPGVPRLLAQFDAAIAALKPEQRWDIRPWNLIYTADGLRVIDSDRGDTPRDTGDVDRVRNWISMLDV